jgi:hypothetical protein
MGFCKIPKGDRFLSIGDKKCPFWVNVNSFVNADNIRRRRPFLNAQKNRPYWARYYPLTIFYKYGSIIMLKVLVNI